MPDPRGLEPVDVHRLLRVGVEHARGEPLPALLDRLVERGPRLVVPPFAEADEREHPLPPAQEHAEQLADQEDRSFQAQVDRALDVDARELVRQRRRRRLGPGHHGVLEHAEAVQRGEHRGAGAGR